MKISFGDWLRQKIEKRGWDQSELARRTGLAHGQISRFISGSRHPGPNPCIAIADALGLSREEVFRARGWLLSDQKEPQVKLSPEVFDIAVEIDRLPSKARRAALRTTKAMAEALREEIEG